MHNTETIKLGSWVPAMFTRRVVFLVLVSDGKGDGQTVKGSACLELRTMCPSSFCFLHIAVAKPFRFKELDP